MNFFLRRVSILLPSHAHQAKVSSPEQKRHATGKIESIDQKLLRLKNR